MKDRHGEVNVVRSIVIRAYVKISSLSLKKLNLIIFQSLNMYVYQRTTMYFELKNL